MWLEVMQTKQNNTGEPHGAENRTFQFEQATVMLTVSVDFKGRARPKLYIQAIDAYRYQRELSIEYRHRPGNSDDMYWECHAYRHPGVRHITEPSKAVAEKLIARILELCEKYPSLLFNSSDDAGPGRARHEGFVHFHDILLAGADPSVKLLE